MLYHVWCFSGIEGDSGKSILFTTEKGMAQEIFEEHKQKCHNALRIDEIDLDHYDHYHDENMILTVLLQDGIATVNLNLERWKWQV
jgi:hypothetical protein